MGIVSVRSLTAFWWTGRYGGGDKNTKTSVFVVRKNFKYFSPYAHSHKLQSGG